MSKITVKPPYTGMLADFVVLKLLSKDESIPEHKRKRLMRLVDRLEYLETKTYPFQSVNNKDKYPV